MRIEKELQKELDIYVDRLKLSTNKDFRSEIRQELFEYLRKVEPNAEKRVDYMVYVFERENNGRR